MAKYGKTIVKTMGKLRDSTKKLAESLDLEDGFLRSFDGGDDSNGGV